MSDLLRAAIMDFIRALVPFLVLMGFLKMTDQQVAALMLVVGTFVTILGLVFKQGQSQGPPMPTASRSVSSTGN